MKRKSKIVFFTFTDADSFYILLARRKVSEKEDFWWLPGGSAEEGESDFHALLREINEEIELPLSFQNTIDHYNLNATVPPSLKYLSTKAKYTIFFVKLSVDALLHIPKIKEEFEEMKWFALNSLPENMSREFNYLHKNMNTAYLNQLLILDNNEFI